jgi:hypothetical protein
VVKRAKKVERRTKAGLNEGKGVKIVGMFEVEEAAEDSDLVSRAGSGWVVASLAQLGSGSRTPGGWFGARSSKVERPV